MLLNIMLLADHGKKKTVENEIKRILVKTLVWSLAFVVLEANNDIASRDALQP